MLQRRKSEEFFHQKPENLNCAQSVLRGFQQELNIPQSRIDLFRAYGGGRTPDGTCGALYVADMLLREQGKDSVSKEFEEKAGATACLNIRRAGKTSCMDCVKIADRLMENSLN